jgi:hypothetical protein
MIPQTQAHLVALRIPLPSPLLESDALPSDDFLVERIQLDDQGDPVLDARWRQTAERYD